jgi:hypothetical protein
MPTQEMPDNELDDLFRKAAGEYNAEFEPEPGNGWSNC